MRLRPLLERTSLLQKLRIQLMILQILPSLMDLFLKRSLLTTFLNDLIDFVKLNLETRITLPGLDCRRTIHGQLLADASFEAPIDQSLVLRH